MAALTPDSRPAVEPLSRQGQPALRAFAGVAACLLLAPAILWPTTRSMVEIWSRSETFQHCWLVFPIVLWLVWEERWNLARTPVRPFWPGLAAIALLGFGWLLGVLGAAQVVTHFALVGLILVLVVTLFGLSWARILWFPLLFLFFAVPFGEAIVPRLMEWTADFTVAALRLSGVPVYREGMHFVIPSGQWSVVEACSGIRYLMASAMAGALYAWLIYRSPIKRALFFAASLGVPLIANWLRAYGIVVLGHLSNNAIATGVDHLVYGWLFFGLVIGSLFWVGTRWREDGASVRGRAAARSVPGVARTSLSSLLQRVALVVAVLAVWPVSKFALERVEDRRALPPLVITPANGWSISDAPVSNWSPVLEGPARLERVSLSKDGHRVTLTSGLYRNQKQGSELVNSMNQVVSSADQHNVIIWSGKLELADSNGSIDANAHVVRSAGREVAVVQWYWVGSARTTSDARAKLDLAFDRLLMRGDTSAWVSLHTPAPQGMGSAAPIFRDFMKDMGEALEAALTQVAQR